MREHVWKRQGVRQNRSRGLPIALATAALLLVAIPTISGAQDAPPIRVSGQCVGPTESDNVALATTQLSGYGISADVSMPATVELGEPATVSIALSFELSEYLVEGAGVLGIESATFAGSEFPVTLVSPAGSEQKVVIPSNPVVDTSSASRIELGSAQFDVPTDAPGVIQLQLDPSTLTVETTPADLSATATCTESGYSNLPVGFIVDPSAPTINPNYSVVDVDPDTQGTVDLSSSVVAGPGPIVEDSWRIVRTNTVGEASASVDNGELTYEVGRAPAEVVWEVCGLSDQPVESTSTTSSTTTTTEADSGEEPGTDEDSQVELAVESDDPTGEDPAADPTTHCAQGLLRLQSASATEVLSSSANVSVPTTPPATSVAPAVDNQTGGTPVSVTG